MYTDKVIANTEIDDTIIKIVGIKHTSRSMLLFKLGKAIAPSLGSLTDGLVSSDRSVMFASCFNILARNANADLFDELQTTLLGSILGSDSEPLKTPERINDYLESKGLNIFDLLVFTFEHNLWSDVVNSNLFKQNIDKLAAIKTQFSDVFTLPDQSDEAVEDDAEQQSE